MEQKARRRRAPLPRRSGAYLLLPCRRNLARYCNSRYGCWCSARWCARRVHVPAAFTLRQLHGVIQVAMGWEGIHLFQFHLRAIRYGSWEISARSPEVTLESLRLRGGARFAYEYDLNIPWRHEIRLEEHAWSPSPNEPIRFAWMATRPVHPRIAAGRTAILSGARLGVQGTGSTISAAWPKLLIRPC